MLHPIPFLRTLGVVEAVQCAHQIAGDAPHALEKDALTAFLGRCFVWFHHVLLERQNVRQRGREDWWVEGIPDTPEHGSGRLPGGESARPRPHSRDGHAFQTGIQRTAHRSACGQIGRERRIQQGGHAHGRCADAPTDVRMPGLHQQCLPHQQLTASLLPDHTLETLLELRAETARVHTIQPAIHKTKTVGRADHSSHVQGKDVPLHHPHCGRQPGADAISPCRGQMGLRRAEDDLHAASLRLHPVGNLRPRGIFRAAIPGRTLLRRKIAQGLAVNLQDGALVIGEGIVRHQQVIRGGKTLVTLGAQALEAGLLAVVFGQTGRLGLGGSLLQTGFFFFPQLHIRRDLACVAVGGQGLIVGWLIAAAQPFDVPLLPIPLQGVHALRSVEIKGQGQTVHDYEPVRRHNGYSGHVFSPYFLPHCGGLKNLSGTVGSTTLSTSQIPSHSHSYSTVNAPGSTWGQGSTQLSRSDRTTGTTGGSSSHAHSLSGSTRSSDSLPPYYAGHYAIRV
nr:MAG TPA: hypothetical protein [Caudoviricetes sp.]